MSTPKLNKAAAAKLTLQDIDGLVAEISDYLLTEEQMKADVANKFAAMDEQLAVIKEASMPSIEQTQTALTAVQKSLDERWKIVEAWAEAHKKERFAEPRSLKMVRATIGFRLTPPKVTALKDWTMAMCALALKRRTWGRDFLHPAKIDHEAILRARAEFEARPERLAAVGLQITQDDNFYVDPVKTRSDAFGREAA